MRRSCALQRSRLPDGIPPARPAPTCRRRRRCRRLLPDLLLGTAPAQPLPPPSIHAIIGRGRQSKVYKARLKQSLEYVVVKACAKDCKPRVLQEVGGGWGGWSCRVVGAQQCRNDAWRMWIVGHGR